MFPSVLKDETLKEKLKQKHWDDRLASKGAIPEYSPLNDKHAKSYRRLISSKNKQQQDFTEPKTKKTTFFEKRMQLIDELRSTHRPNQKLLDEYEQLAGKYKLPNFYIYYSLLPLLSPSQNITQYLFNQRKKLKEQSSHYHKISTAIRAREECLERLRKTLAHLNEEKLQNSRGELRQQVEHMRFLTENVIDEIKRWRDDLGKVDDRPIFYNDNLENYLAKILNDNKFIFSSKLAGALSFPQKNDPFLLVPVKKAEGREASMFTSIVELTKDVGHYQKYMEFLASEKAYQLNASTPVKHRQPSKNPSVQKIYKAAATLQPKIQAQTIKEGQEEDEFKKMEILKMRQERLKKNEERIKSIKSIYETYGKKGDDKDKQYRSERKMPETDSEDRRGLKKKSESIKILRNDKKQADNQFQLMVKNKLETEQVQSTPHRRMAKSQSNNKLPKVDKVDKTENQIIQNLKDIQSNLKSKLHIIQQQQKNESSFSLNLSQQKFTRKNNEEIIKQLKAEIMSKIQKESIQKQRTKKRKRQQEQKALEQIKQKLKKEMEQKLEQKKKQKLLERQQLERKLKEEEDRLNSQRQLELQLQIKLNKEKELRELEKIKRENLEREKKFKEELEREQALRRQKEEQMGQQRRQNEQLLEQIKRRDIKEQIEDQLRKEIKDRSQNDKSRLNDLQEQELIRSQKQFELSKQIQHLKLKQGVEMEQLKKQNELRARMLKLKKDEEQLKRKQIEYLMKQAIHNEKEELQKDAMQKRVQIQDHMRNNVKEKLLEEYRNQKEAEVEKIKHQREQKLQEEVYRDKIREKIQKEMRIEAIQRTKKDLDDREQKKYEIKNKLDSIKNQFDQQITLDKGKIQQEVKKEMIEKVIFDKQAEKEAAKYDLRLQFERQLMASAIPQLYQNKQSFLVKNINYVEGDAHLNSKLDQNKPTNQKPANNTSPTKKTDVKPLIDTMTMEQLSVYEKQKHKVNETKQEKIMIPSRQIEQQQGFELLKVDRSKKSDHHQYSRIDKNIRQTPLKQSEITQKQQKKHRKKKREEVSDSSDSEQRRKRKSKKHKRHKQYDEQSDDSSKEKRRSKKKKNKKRRRQSSEENSSEQGQMLPIQTQITKKQSYQQMQPQNYQPSTIKMAPVKQQLAPLKPEKSEKARVHYDVQEKSKLFNQIDQVTIKPQKMSNISEKFYISLQAIPEAEFDQYLEVHLSRVPQIQLAVQLINREQLYRKLIGQLTFCLLVGQFQGRVVGLALAYHDRNRSDVRKFSIIHIATYLAEDLKEFILSCTNFIFRKDPCDEIEFYYKFNEGVTDQLDFSQDFNKWVDKYGSVFQKKVDDAIYQRKYLLKRQFNQKCQVVLGGINKNTFRNIFSVYCGVLMSDSDMLQFKEQLVDTLAPQNQICYSIMISQLFRTYLTPDEADALKNKVKQFAKLKELLILVVMMQKKKLKLQQLKLYEYRNLIELNMRLMSQGKQIIRYCKDSNADINRLYYAELNHAFNLPFHFQTTSLPVEAKQNEIRQISYFRLSSLPPFKLHIIKSSLYNAQMNILPTQNSKYKIFVISAQQYNQIKESNSLDLFMYIRLFLKNVKSHNVAVWKYVWLPQMTDKGAWNLRQYKSFLTKDFYTHDAINISYRQFLPGALIIEPEHRDLVITPPFIVGVMSMNLQQVSEGSPLYARMIEVDALKTMEVE